MSLEKRTLDNGLTIYNDRIVGARTNDVRMYVPYGSVDEDPGHEGVAHVFEHCVHLQTDSFEDRVALRQYANINGMYTNASTNFTSTDYYANGLELEPSMVHLSQILQHTHFPEEAVEHELKAVRREMKTRLDSPGEAHFLGAMNAMYGLPYGRSIGGFHDKIDFDVETLRDLHNRYYKLGRMTLLVAGKARMDEVADMASRYFEADIDPSYAELPELPRTLGRHRRTGLVREDSSNALVAVSHPLTPEFIEQKNANMLAYGIAEKALSQAAFQALRYQHGISYNGTISIDNIHPNAVILSGDVTTDGEHVDKAIDIFNQVFSRSGADYSDEELAGNIAAYKYAYNAQFNSNATRVNRLKSALEQQRPPADIGRQIRKIGKIGVAEVRQAIDEMAKYAATHPRYVHVTGKRSAVGEAERIIDQSEVA